MEDVKQIKFRDLKAKRKLNLEGMYSNLRKVSELRIVENKFREKTLT